MHPASPRRRLLVALLALFPALSAALTAGAARAAEAGPAPRLEAELLDGSRFSLAQRRDGITLVSVWSPESLSSRKCIWELQRFATAYDARGVQVLAASTLDNPAALRAFVAERKLTLPVGILRGHELGPLDELRFPLVYVFDRNGQLRAAHAGLYSMRVLERLVAPLLPP
ncbi:MAG TPA: TlpA disulfide reductase family protein [Noviherbaspirillum sp.]|uniref:TlpA family protein disulfide reductase n=1 Tax=Noviherbaspirillum sp. TaxID=1926288 RepID=UPI002D36FEF7|nr:TlpA disulfide reductase family protein [Noviherbaspirillum sp.]HYD94962.1 TlpA disulfide reductase family protein [Noviherbaspirillum sp.]